MKNSLVIDGVNFDYYKSKLQDENNKLLVITDLLMPAEAYLPFFESLEFEFYLPIMTPDILLNPEHYLSEFIKQADLNDAKFTLVSHLTGSTLKLLQFKRNIKDIILIDPMLGDFIPYEIEKLEQKCCRPERLDIDQLRSEIQNRNYNDESIFKISDIDLEIKFNAFNELEITNQAVLDLIQFAKDELIDIKIIQPKTQLNIKFTTKTSFADSKIIDSKSFMFGNERLKLEFTVAEKINAVENVQEVEMSD